MFNAIGLGFGYALGALGAGALSYLFYQFLDAMIDGGEEEEREETRK